MANAIDLCYRTEYLVNYAQTRQTEHKCILQIDYSCNNFKEKNNEKRNN